jgi:hypothetical protein
MDRSPRRPPRYPAADYERLADVMPWICICMENSIGRNTEIPAAVPFDKITETPIKGGFQGWMSTEFEGGELGAYQNSFEVVKVHHAVVKRAIGKYAKA